MPVTVQNFLAIATLSDARDFIVSYLQDRLNDPAGRSPFGQSYGFSIFLDGIRSHVRDYTSPQLYGNVDAGQTASDHLQAVSLKLMDAAWELCLQGHLRPGPQLPDGQAVSAGLGNGYSMTASGEEWIKQQPHL